MYSIWRRPYNNNNSSSFSLQEFRINQPFQLLPSSYTPSIRTHTIYCTVCIDSEEEERDHPGTYFLYFMFLLFEIGNMRNDIHFDDDVLLLPRRPQPKFRITHRHTIPGIKWSFIVETQQARNISPTIDKL